MGRVDLTVYLSIRCLVYKKMKLLVPSLTIFPMLIMAKDEWPFLDKIKANDIFSSKNRKNFRQKSNELQKFQETFFSSNSRTRSGGGCPGDDQDKNTRGFFENILSTDAPGTGDQATTTLGPELTCGCSATTEKTVCFDPQTFKKNDYLTQPEGWMEFQERIETDAKRDSSFKEEYVEELETCVRRCNRRDKWNWFHRKSHEHLKEDYASGKIVIPPFSCIECVEKIPTQLQGGEDNSAMISGLGLAIDIIGPFLTNA